MEFSQDDLVEEPSSDTSYQAYEMIFLIDPRQDYSVKVENGKYEFNLQLTSHATAQDAEKFGVAITEMALKSFIKKFGNG